MGIAYLYHINSNKYMLTLVVSSFAVVFENASHSSRWFTINIMEWKEANKVRANLNVEFTQTALGSLQ